MVQQSQKTRLKIKPDYFYYLDLKNPLEPVVLRDTFDNRIEAKSCFNKHLKNPRRYFLVKGDLLIKYKESFKIKKAPYSVKVIHHDYRKIPVFSDPSKRQLRRINRRRLREEKRKMLGIKKPKFKYDYPEDCITDRQKSSYREWVRRKFHKQFNYIH